MADTENFSQCKEAEDEEPVEEGLTKQQKRNKKKREAKKKKKALEGENVVNPANEASNADAASKDKSNNVLSEEDHFEEELCWCIHQLQLGVENQKGNKNQNEQAHKLIKQLKSEKTPKPKKRMLMRTTFGDYRQKIAAEKKRAKQKGAPIRAVAVDDSEAQKSIFVKKKTNDLPSFSKEEENTGGGFCFNFADPNT